MNVFIKYKTVFSYSIFFSLIFVWSANVLAAPYYETNRFVKVYGVKSQYFYMKKTSLFNPCSAYKGSIKYFIDNDREVPFFSISSEVFKFRVSDIAEQAADTWNKALSGKTPCNFTIRRVSSVLASNLIIESLDFETSSYEYLRRLSSTATAVGIFEGMKKGNYYPPAGIYINYGRISSADERIRRKVSGSDEDISRFFALYVMTHEFGHVLGLGHPTLMPVYAVDKPTDFDFSGIETYAYVVPVDQSDYDKVPIMMGTGISYIDGLYSVHLKTVDSRIPPEPSPKEVSVIREITTCFNKKLHATSNLKKSDSCSDFIQSMRPDNFLNLYTIPVKFMGGALLNKSDSGRASL